MKKKRKEIKAAGVSPKKLLIRRRASDERRRESWSPCLEKEKVTPSERGLSMLSQAKERTLLFCLLHGTNSFFLYKKILRCIRMWCMYTPRSRRTTHSEEGLCMPPVHMKKEETDWKKKKKKHTGDRGLRGMQSPRVCPCRTSPV